MRFKKDHVVAIAECREDRATVERSEIIYRSRDAGQEGTYRSAWNIYQVSTGTLNETNDTRLFRHTRVYYNVADRFDHFEVALIAS